MKKISLILTLIVSCLLFSSNVYAIPVASSNLSFQTCYAFADEFKTITINEKQYYYKYCYRATCSQGVYNKANMVSDSAYRCQNGNYAPLVKITSDGCASYTGTCNTKNSTYCTRVVLVDCDRMVDGSTYNYTTTRTTTTTRKTTTTKKTTTKKTTTKKTTKKTTTTKRGGTTTTKKTSTKVIITVSRTTTTEPTTTTVKNPSKETGIKKLVIAGNEVTDIDKNEFEISVPYGVADVTVKAVLEDENATYVVSGNKDMPDESGHIITIEVTAEDGVTTETTTLIVQRYVKKSSNCKLANIHSDDVSIDFSKNKFDYTLKIPKDLNALDLQVTLADEEKELYTIEGNENLKTNSEIKIIVVAEDETECVYTIKVKKPNDAWKVILLIIAIGGILVASGYFGYRYIKKSKGRYKYE